MSQLDEFLHQCGMDSVPSEADEQFATYLELLLKWNKKLNLTSIRTSEGILQRHFVESIFCARRLSPSVKTVLDIGSGGGFPGVPIAICRPEIVVTLAESQGKKAAFLRETIRTLGLSAIVHGGRAEDLTAVYDAVTLRAVDRMADAVSAAVDRVAVLGEMVLMIGASDAGNFNDGRIVWERPIPIPNSEQSVILMGQRTKS